jgi:tetratricopeptide (TPR) repeat protein
MVRHDSEDGRYEIHELLRQYAAQKLEAVPRVLKAVQSAHADYFARFMASKWEEHTNDGRPEAMDDVVADLENVRAALRHELSRGNGLNVGKFLKSLWWSYNIRGWFQPGESLFREIADTLAQPPFETAGQPVCALARALQAWFTVGCGQPVTARSLAKESLKTLRSHNAGEELLFALYSLNLAARNLDDVDERAHYAHELYAAALAQNDDRMLGIAAYWQALAALHDRQDYEEASQYGQESLRLAERVGNKHQICFACSEILAVIAIERGDHEGARRLLLKGLQAGKEFDSRPGILEAYTQLGYLYLNLEDPEQALDYILQSLELCLDMRVTQPLLKATLLLGRAYAQLGNEALAVELLTAVAEDPVSALAVSPRKAALDALGNLEARLPQTTFETAVERGQVLDIETFVADLVRRMPDPSGYRQE